MNLKEAARRLGVHYQTAYRWVRSGELVAVRIGSRYEVSDAAIERLRAQRRALGTPHIEELPRRGDSIEAELTKLADGPMLDVEQAVVHLSRRIAESTGDLCVVAVLTEARDRVEAASCFEPDSQRLPILSGAIAATMRMRAPDEGPVMRTVFEGHQLFVPHVPQELVPGLAPPRVPPAVRRRVHLRDGRRADDPRRRRDRGHRHHARATRASVHRRGRRPRATGSRRARAT